MSRSAPFSGVAPLDESSVLPAQLPSNHDKTDAVLFGLRGAVQKLSWTRGTTMFAAARVVPLPGPQPLAPPGRSDTTHVPQAASQPVCWVAYVARQKCASPAY